MIRLSREVMAAFRADAELRRDRDTAARFRAKNRAEVAHLDDDALLAAIKAARETAVSFGISDQELRVRFIMLDVFRLPGFWRDKTAQKMLRAETGTPETRFGDVCAFLKQGAIRTGKPTYVWWS